MYQVNEKIIQAHQDSMASVHAFSKKATENTHDLAQTHLDASKELLTKTHQRMMGLGKQKDPKDLIHVFTAEGLKEATTDLMTYQTTVTASLHKNQKEIIEKADDAYADAKKHLQELVNGAISNAPPGSEAFTASFKMIFETTLQGYDQIRSKVKNTYTLSGETVDTAIATHKQETQKGVKRSVKKF